MMLGYVVGKMQNFSEEIISSTKYYYVDCHAHVDINKPFRFKRRFHLPPIVVC